jgi:hypothetical protein
MHHSSFKRIEKRDDRTQTLLWNGAVITLARRVIVMNCSRTGGISLVPKQRLDVVPTSSFLDHNLKHLLVLESISDVSQDANESTCDSNSLQM